MRSPVSAVRMLEDLALWAGVLAALMILVAWKLVDGEARKRLRVAFVFLVLGSAIAVVGTVGHLKFVRLLGVVGVGLALVRAMLVLLFDILPLLRQTPKIVRDINAGFTYFVAIMVLLGGAGVKIESLLTTSALLTAVLGFALQDTLGNLFAGLALQAQRPFAVGDWIHVEGGTAPPGRVLEINWRATKVLTLDQVEVSYPNSVLAKTPVTNFSLPTTVARRNLYLHASYSHAPDHVCELMVAATESAKGVLAEPPPTAVVSNFDASGVQYWVRFFIDDWAKRDLVDSEVWARLWYVLDREGVEIPYPTQSLYLHEVSDASADRERERSVAHRQEALGEVDFLRALQPDDVRSLAEKLRVRHYGPGETVLSQGDDGESFFLIQAGQVSVHLTSNDGSTNEVAQLRQGQFFGEMSLMTGEKRTATVKAESRVELYEIDHESFASVLLGHEAVAKQMSAILAERQLRLGERGSTLGATVNDTEARTEMLFSRIKKFFKL